MRTRGLRGRAVPVILFTTAISVGAWFGSVTVSAGTVAGPGRALPVATTEPPPIGVGGFADLAGGSIVQMFPGREYVTAATAVNTGKAPIEVNLASSLPLGVTTESLVPLPYRLEPGEQVRVALKLIASETVAAGSYESSISLQPTARATGGGVKVLPAFSVSFWIRVLGGEPADVTVQAVNSDDGGPAKGTLSVVFLPSDSPEVAIAEEVGSSLNLKLGPGRYRARFKIEGLTEQSETFTIEKGEESRDVVIRIKGISFVTTRVTRQGSGAARVVLAIRNNLGRFAGPVHFEVEVRRDDELVENFRIATLAELPEGLSEQQTLYGPRDGFRPGTWTFEFSVSTPTYVVTAPTTESFEVPWTPGKWTALVTLGVLAAGGVTGWSVWRRRPGRTRAGRRRS